MNYKQSVEYIHSRNKFGIKLGLEATSLLLSKIGNPHQKMRFVHVAGTNGKGSTSSYIANILMAKGFKTGKFISPYVHSFTERIQINNVEITPEHLAKYTSVVKDAIDKYQLTPTEFEVVTAIGLLYFAEMECDYVVLEVGMGGRFDATNVIPSPEVAVITSISLDHTEYLGDTISKIAYEKCGIIKQDCMVVAYPKNSVDADDVIKNVIKEKGATLTIPATDEVIVTRQDIKGTDFVYNGVGYTISMIGEHQIYNAITAIEATKALDIEDQYIKEGLKLTQFAGRLDVIGDSPLIIQDGAHNISGITELKKVIETYFQNRKVIIILSMLKDKEYKKCIEIISEVTDILIATQSSNPRRATAEEIAETAKKYIKDVYINPDVNDAIKTAKDKADKDDLIIVCGSLYLLGEIKS